jgi:cystathionine beta-lyase/cystathionine gamma-synthase
MQHQSGTKQTERGRGDPPKVAVHPQRGRAIRREKHAGTLIRLHIGLEDPDDLVADLEQGLAVWRAATS